MLRKFNPEGALASPFYSHGVVATGPGRTLYVSGQVGSLPDGSVADGMGPQTLAAIANLKGVLAGAGMTIDDIAKLTIYLTDESLMGDFQAAGAGLLASPPPAITLLFVKALASPALLIEIEAVAFKSGD